MRCPAAGQAPAATQSPAAAQPPAAAQYARYARCQYARSKKGPRWLDFFRYFQHLFIIINFTFKLIYTNP